MAEYITVKTARERFHLTRYKMTTLINKGLIPTYENPRDARLKLINPDELTAYLESRQRKPKKAEAAQ